MQSSFHSTGGKPTVLRPDVDVVLSLKNSVYKSVMFDCFVRLGSKKNDQNNDAEKESARDALWVLRGRSKVGDRPARFFKPESRYASRSFVEVDESAALESEFPRFFLRSRFVVFCFASAFTVRFIMPTSANTSLEITADIYRRMESAKRWLISDGTDDDPTSESQRPRKSKPPPAHAPLEAASSKKRKSLKRTPESLPFLGNVDENVADIIAGEELRAKRRNADGPRSNPLDQSWQPDEVVNFFRGLYVHGALHRMQTEAYIFDSRPCLISSRCSLSKKGWNEWTKVSTMVKTRSNQNVKLYAVKLEKKFPELRDFFSKQGNAVQATKRARTGDVDVPGSMSHNDPAMIAASVMGSMKYQATNMSTKPKVVICLGDYVIDTEAAPSLLKPSIDRKRPAETLPDCFDPSIRPSIPTNNQQIYIPGNNVYARWMNKEDPGSYGTVESCR